MKSRIICTAWTTSGCCNPLPAGGIAQLLARANFGHRAGEPPVPPDRAVAFQLRGVLGDKKRVPLLLDFLCP